MGPDCQQNLCSNNNMKNASPTTMQDVYTLWNYMLMNQKLEKADANEKIIKSLYSSITTLVGTAIFIGIIGNRKPVLHTVTN
jgi:hypothetical protein